ncbi:hypothetical protein K474DRAFT_564439 [Panus rudis PR-1116 ss-1]|nr:hypothetical protein K474DRAFT_564439 [Panus rudis PR-1116 ss-1]
MKEAKEQRGFLLGKGRSLRADYKLIAKALGRIGSAYSKKNDLDTAIKYFNKSLTEHRTPDILNKLREAERTRAEAARRAYIDPAKAEQAREEGNALFKKGDYAGAVKAYTEAIKRDPSDPRGYNNRANAYTKLVALPEALKDAEEAIKKHTREIQELALKCQQALFSQREGESEEETLQRAMRDPEVAVKYHVRSHYAVDIATGSVEPRCIAGPHEEPRCPSENHEADQCRYHQDTMKLQVVPFL